MFKRKKWKYLILDEAHMIKNWKSQRWQVCAMQQLPVAAGPAVWRLSGSALRASGPGLI